MKVRLEVENWTGASIEAIYQDFHVTVFTKNLAAILAQPAQQFVTQQSQTKKYPYQETLYRRIICPVSLLLSTSGEGTFTLAVNDEIVPANLGPWRGPYPPEDVEVEPSDTAEGQMDLRQFICKISVLLRISR